MGGKYTNYPGYLSSKELKNLWATHQTCRQTLLGDSPRPRLYSEGETPRAQVSRPAAFPPRGHRWHTPWAGGNRPPSAMSQGCLSGTVIGREPPAATRPELREGTRGSAATGWQPPPRDAFPPSTHPRPLKCATHTHLEMSTPGHGAGREMPLRFLCS